MPLFLKNIAPELDIFGNRQIFNFNKDPAGGESDSALTLINWFTPISNVNANSTFEFLTPTLKGFRFNHSLSTTGTFGNFNFEKYDRFGLATPLWGYNEITDSFTFFKNVSLSITGDLNLNSNKITNLGVGVLSTDAANKGQMDTADAATLTSAQTYTNNKTWTASQITNFDTQVRTSRLDQMALPTSSLNLNNQKIVNQLDPTNAQDSATMAFVLAAVNKSILHGYNAATYSTNVAVGDHIKFDSSVFTRGTAITLDTSSTYSNATNTASVGRITLAAGKTYKLTGSINNIVSANYNGMRWYNSDTGATLGVISGMSSPDAAINRVPSAGFVAYITTSVSTRVELRIIWNALSSVNGTADGIGPAWFIVEEV